MTELDLDAADPLRDNPALEQAIRRILDEHMELALQEIKRAIQRNLSKP
jgi:ribosomal protein S21